MFCHLYPDTDQVPSLSENRKKGLKPVSKIRSLYQIKQLKKCRKIESAQVGTLSFIPKVTKALMLKIMLFAAKINIRSYYQQR